MNHGANTLGLPHDPASTTLFEDAHDAELQKLATPHAT
jgi:hypothetical protein